MADRRKRIHGKLANASPRAEFVLWGAEDVADSRIHGGNESVDPTEIERMIVAEALLVKRLGEAYVESS